MTLLLLPIPGTGTKLTLTMWLQDALLPRRQFQFLSESILKTRRQIQWS